ELTVDNAIFFFEFRLWGSAVIEDLHFKAEPCPSDNLLPDAAHADNAHSRVMHVGTEELPGIFLLSPFSLFDDIVQLRYPSCCGKHQAESQIRHCFIQHEWRMRAEYPMLFHRFQVERIVADR